MKGAQFIQQAIELALLAEREGNLPIGAVIALDDEVIAEGRNAILVPEFDATRHAEMEAIRAVPAELWASAREMELYTTLEPCLMCAGSILLHRIGKVSYGSADDYGGASVVFENLPPYFRERSVKTQLEGPILPDECDLLNERVMELVLARRD
ncbi:MAG: nucleoside deaminase [Anaerolineales bacterium]